METLSKPIQKIGYLMRASLLRLCRAIPIAQLQAEVALAFNRGKAQGLVAGQKTGEAIGYAKGYAKGKTVLAIDWQDPPPKAPQVDDDLVPQSSLGLNAALAQQIKVDFAKKLASNEQPTLDQEKMILSDVRCTYVIAGAGSGKSTSLVLRLVVLHIYLRIPLENLSVFTFTKASRIDFASKMRKVFAKWNTRLDEPASLAIVRTFHSVILKFMRSVHPRITAFENLGRKNKQTDQQIQEATFAQMDDEDEAPDNPFDTKLANSQLDLLKDTYQQTYQSDAGFREQINVLLRRSLEMKRVDPHDPKVVSYLKQIVRVAQRDRNVCAAVRNSWVARKHWPITGVRDVNMAITIEGQTFYSDGVVDATSLPVFLGWDDEGQFGEPSMIKDTSFDARTALFIKHRIIRAKFHGRAYFLENVRQAKQLECLLTYTSDGLKNYVAPMFDFKQSGDVKSLPIHEAFWGAGSFIESMNMNVMDAIGKIRVQKDSSDEWFCAALSRFWAAFTQQLHTKDILTFNQMFMLFSERHATNLELVSDGVLKSLQHLMIDEFQDISPQIVSWIRASAMQLRRRGMDNSLLCVGDDWQSIYGWRGSAPHYLIEFEQYFKASQYLSVGLQENYRCSQLIIDAAEAMLKDVAYKSKKHGLSSGTAANVKECPQWFETEDFETIVAHIESTVQREPDSSVMVLSRKKKALEVVQKMIKPKLRSKVAFKTFHTSKGLEAHSVILIGDCAYDGTSPIKNELYRIAGLKQTYDAAQRDESKRLAYVALTRAERWSYWFSEKGAGAFGAAKASATLFKQGGTPLSHGN